MSKFATFLVVLVLALTSSASSAADRSAADVDTPAQDANTAILLVEASKRCNWPSAPSSQVDSWRRTIIIASNLMRQGVANGYYSLNQALQTQQLSMNPYYFALFLRKDGERFDCGNYWESFWNTLQAVSNKLNDKPLYLDLPLLEAQKNYLWGAMLYCVIGETHNFDDGTTDASEIVKASIGACNEIGAAYQQWSDGQMTPSDMVRWMQMEHPDVIQALTSAILKNRVAKQDK